MHLLVYVASLFLASILYRVLCARCMGFSNISFNINNDVSSSGIESRVLGVHRYVTEIKM